ncbi:MAG: hypothetical protein K2X38_19490 [Gemmataceae bacterium]|nr:hypothetical protein [Gemmataceae bacterium]
MLRIHILAAASALCFSTFLTGCNDGLPRASISGKVTLDGKPLEQGLIAFAPLDGKSGTGGGPIEKGVYKAEVPLGSFRVTISGTKTTGKKKVYDTPDSPMADVLEELVPPKYNRDSKLTQKIKGNQSDVHFDLTTK